MGRFTMKAKQLSKLGVPKGRLTRLAIALIGPAVYAGLDKAQIRPLITALVKDPAAYRQHPHFGRLADELVRLRAPHEPQPFVPRPEPAPWQRWGPPDLDPASVHQLDLACQLPIAVAGALMPDAHVGYGLPIGGVLATDNAVIPYAVGVDIACRVKLTVLDLPPTEIDRHPDRLIHAIESQTLFGIGAEFKGRDRRDHPVMHADWSVTSLTRTLKDKAWGQLGTSGSGNHFVDIGLLTLDRPDLGLAAGAYLAVLSHSGSRGSGAEVCRYFSHLAMRRHPELPRELRHLAWLNLDSPEGQEYWHAMQLMGQYAAANHQLIHQYLARALSAQVLLDVENHHNFAWLQQHDGRQVVVHRKGATPAHAGALGIIPGSMAAPAFIVRGKGRPDALCSAAHGAGRVMSRTQARQTYRWPQVHDYLTHRGVRVLSAGLDEVPFVYKDIEQVMRYQQDLVEPVARFDPRIVKMAPAGERPED